MSLSAAVRFILSSSPKTLTPQEVRDSVKEKFPECYGTESHRKNVRNGNYQDLDHALLAQIYTLSRTSPWIARNTSVTPMQLSLAMVPLHQTVHPPRNIRTNFVRPRSGHTNFSKNTESILQNLTVYHDAFYAADTFKGPCLYFHRKALEAATTDSFTKHVEYIYAVLTSWGMHRMGSGGSKMQDFEKFFLSIEALQPIISVARNFIPGQMSENDWMCLKDVFNGISVMASGTTIVGNSKVMHHLLPNIIPPIDREYTLWFLKGNGNIRNDLESEWTMMREIISDFFIPILRAETFKSHVAEWMRRENLYPWDTSEMKIIDNLIIGAKVLYKRDMQ